MPGISEAGPVGSGIAADLSADTDALPGSGTEGAMRGRQLAADLAESTRELAAEPDVEAALRTIGKNGDSLRLGGRCRGGGAVVQR